jgi:hypothetical protein
MSVLDLLIAGPPFGRSRRQAAGARTWLDACHPACNDIHGFRHDIRLYPRVGALLAATILVVAAYAIARLHGLNWRWQYPGIEYMLFPGAGLRVR